MSEIDTKELARKTEAWLRDWEEFKTQNTQLIKDEAKGAAVAMQKELTEKLNDAITEQREEVKQLKVALNRSALSDTIADHKERAVAKAKKEFREFARGNLNLKEFEIKAIQATSDTADGSTVVKHPIQMAVERVLQETDGMRQVATVVQSATNIYEIVVSQADAEVQKGASATETTSAGATDAHNQELVEVRHFNYESRPRISQNLLDDEYYDLETQLGMEVGEAIERSQNADWITGAGGTSAPQGILDPVAGSPSDTWGLIQPVSATSSGSPLVYNVTSNDLINFFYGTQKRYRRNGSWVMSGTTLAHVRTLTDDQGRYQWTPGFGDEPETLLGRPVFEMSDMPDYTAGNMVIAFGDFRKAYLISDRMGMIMQRDPYTAKPLVEFYTRVRAGGAIKDFNAYRVLQLA